VGMPLFMFIAEGLWFWRRDDRYRQLARTWAKATGILFAIGAVSGTALSFELGLLWPKFMGFAGSTIGPAFALEGFAFFMEAIFLGLYLYGWERLSPLAHLLSGAVVAISGATSSVLVVASNAWRQNPIGADLLTTNPEALNPVDALFRNPAWGIMALHSTLAAYAASAFAVAGIYAWGALRGRWNPLRRYALTIAIAVATITGIAMPITGHQSAQHVAQFQPGKLAAMESQFITQRGAPLRIGGIPNPATGKVPFSLEIPKGLSLLAHGHPDAEVAGLDKIPRADWPNIPLVHYSFQVMVGAGTAMLLLVLLYWWMALGRKRTEVRWLMWLVVLSSPLGFIALETGWMVTEVGRQPWIIYKVMRTTEAVSAAPGMRTVFFSFLTLYALLGIVLLSLLNGLKHNEG
jgi:cytochrome d ubiquinol oxidase subunit I